MKESHSLELASRSEISIWTETVLFAIINVLVFFGNLLTCYIVYRNHRLRTIPNMFVIALAVSDILISICCMPFTVVTLFYGQWIFGETFCRVNGFEVFTFAVASIYCMGVIAISRYFCVVKPERYLVLFRKEKISFYIAFAWLAALVGSVPPIFFEKGGFEFKPGKGMCLYTFESDIGYTLFVGFVCITAPLTLITISYVMVFRAVSRSNRVFSEESDFPRLRANIEEAKVSKTLVAVLVGFVSCWMPIYVIDTTDALRGNNAFPREVYISYAFLLYLSSTINPVIYGVMNKELRREYKDIFSKILRCQHHNIIETETNPEVRFTARLEGRST
ncbi:G protein-coupled receptor 161-like [Stylophora pistillata]|uniref:G protein-coupled receptor 161-like n=1 Tax=Stylophora pistillata TaxID=50429 RepID=UPI000C049CD0|nr:G protein-coupled receptor 161-like [Stylophora pistillata]